MISGLTVLVATLLRFVSLPLALRLGIPALLALFVFFLLAIPFYGLKRGEDTHNPAGRVPGTASRLSVWLTPPIILASLLESMRFIRAGNLGWFEISVYGVCFGLIVGSLGQTVAHELMHSRSRFERVLSVIQLCMMSYPYYAIEHVYGHHPRVGTPDDPATSRWGETFYHFLVRVIPGEISSAYRISGQKRRKKSLLPNPVVALLGCQAVVWIVTGAVFGGKALFFFLLESALAIVTTQSQNYMAHYGLERRRMADGRYEAAELKHSWDCYFGTTNTLLLNIGRHSDHHLRPLAPYPLLRANEVSPRMPYPYALMFLLTLVPPLWFRKMNPLTAPFRSKNAT